MAESRTRRNTNTQNDPDADGFTDDERAAMKERAQELKAKRGGKKNTKEADEAAVLEKIAEMSDDERSIATRIHQIVAEAAPDLAPKTWYGMPAYARDGKVVCFFQPGSKFKARYSTLGFSDEANVDDGSIFPTVFAITELNDAVEKQIGELISRAVS